MTEKFSSVDELLDFAIKQEEQAYDLYTDLANKTNRTGTRDLFQQFAREELGHKAKLLKIKQGKQFDPSPGKILDLKIGDYLLDVEPSPQMNYQDALIVAMKKEKVAFKMYSDMAASVGDPKLRETLLGLANEEAKHKLRFELEYDDEVLNQN